MSARRCAHIRFRTPEVIVLTFRSSVHDARVRCHCAQVMSIRRSAIRKMRMANSVRSSGSSPRSSLGASPSSPGMMLSSPGMLPSSPSLLPASSGYSPGTSTSTISIGASPLGQSPLSYNSAPSTRDSVFGVDSLTSSPSCAMPPPAFYPRKGFSPSSAKPAA